MNNNLLTLTNTIVEKATSRGLYISFWGSLSKVEIEVKKETIDGNAPFRINLFINNNKLLNLRLETTSNCYLGYNLEEQGLDIFDKEGIWVQDAIDMLEFLQELKEICKDYIE